MLDELLIAASVSRTTPPFTNPPRYNTYLPFKTVPKGATLNLSVPLPRSRSRRRAAGRPWPRGQSSCALLVSQDVSFRRVWRVLPLLVGWGAPAQGFRDLGREPVVGPASVVSSLVFTCVFGRGSELRSGGSDRGLWVRGMEWNEWDECHNGFLSSFLVA